MKSRASLQRWLTVAALVTVAVSVGVAGLFVARTLERRIVSEAEASLESVLRLGASRMCAEAREVSGNDRFFFDDRELSAMEEFLWLVEGIPGGPFSREEANFEELARTEGFPFASVMEPPPEESAVRFEVRQGEDGEPYRVAALMLTPALDQPGPGGPGGRGGARRWPRRLDDGGRPGPGSRPGLGPERGGRGRPMGGGPRFAPDEQFKVYLAKSIHEERAILKSLLRTLLLAGLVAAGLSAIIVPWTVRRGLGPVRDISAKISAVDESRLDLPLEVEAIPAELEPIVQSFESVRERLSSAFAREGRFTSNAAHELRTPLAGLRASMEVALRRERTTDQYRSIMNECLGITCSMQGMVDSLLILAKGTQQDQETEPVDLESVLRRAFAANSEAMEARGLTVQWSEVGDPTVTCVALLAERIAANIASNAVQYAAAGSTISVALEEAGDHVGVRTGNDTEALAPDTAERALEPLWRGDAARTDATLHAGLGLSIVQQCVEAMGGAVSVETSGDRFELSLSLPR